MKKKGTHSNIGLTPFEKAFAQFLAYVITQDDTEDDAYEWRDTVENGWEFGIFPEDFEYEFDYLDALEAAKLERQLLEEEEDYQRQLEENELENHENWQENLSDAVKAKIEKANLDIDNYDSEEELIEEADRFYQLNQQLALEIKDKKTFSKLSHDAKLKVLGAACGIDRGPYNSVREYENDVRYFSGLHQIEDQKALEAFQLGYAYQAYIQFYELFATVYIRPKDFKNIYEYKKACEEAAKEITILQRIYKYDTSRARREHAKELFQIKYDLGMCYASEKDKQDDIKRLKRLIKLEDPVHELQ